MQSLLTGASEPLGDGVAHVGLAGGAQVDATSELRGGRLGGRRGGHVARARAARRPDGASGDHRAPLGRARVPRGQTHVRLRRQHVLSPRSATTDMYVVAANRWEAPIHRRVTTLRCVSLSCTVTLISHGLITQLENSFIRSSDLFESPFGCRFNLLHISLSTSIKTFTIISIYSYQHFHIRIYFVANSSAPAILLVSTCMASPN